MDFRSLGLAPTGRKGTPMKTNWKNLAHLVAVTLIAVMASLAPGFALAHCDSLDGPVLVEAKAALAKRDVTPLLKWIPKADEAEITAAFQKTVALSGKGADVKEMAEMYFFETLVRIHRAGEGFAYTGLKATVKDAGPAVLGADQALEIGCPQALTNLVTGEAAEGIRRRFDHTMELRAKADTSVEAGREYVAAYVDYVHYVEGVHTAAEKSAPHGGEEKTAEAKPKGGCGHK
jgi:hypothetical protein